MLQQVVFIITAVIVVKLCDQHGVVIPEWVPWSPVLCNECFSTEGSAWWHACGNIVQFLLV